MRNGKFLPNQYSNRTNDMGMQKDWTGEESDSNSRLNSKDFWTAGAFQAVTAIEIQQDVTSK